MSVVIYQIVNKSLLKSITAWGAILLLAGLSSSCSLLEKAPEPPPKTLPDKDTEAPQIQLKGGDLVIERHQYFTDPGATATDDFDGQVTVTVSGKVKSYALGSYTLTYTAIDQAGNRAEVQRQVKIVPYSTVPPLNDTGITWAANYPQGNEERCRGELAAMQDCAHGGNGFNFTKLDAEGRPLPRSAKRWACVKDNHTGLIWEVKTRQSKRAGLHSREDQYNWRNLIWASNGGATGWRNHDGAICTGFVAGQEHTYCNTHAFVQRVNKKGLCGAHDWRLPNIQELTSLLKLRERGAKIDRRYFPNTRRGGYWSSTPVAFDKSVNWQLDFSTGRDTVTARRDELYVRLVRTAHPGGTDAD